KKKFVVNTEYCITLDKIPKELYPEILENEEQIEEWKDLYALEEQEDQGLEQFTGSDEIDEEFLKQNHSMMVDTKHFDEEFKYKILSNFSSIDDNVGGSVYKAENYQAISLLRTKYREEIDHIYIDPPYNTKNNAIIYKNNYKHSSWLSLMKDRLSKSKDLLKDDGVLTTAIDENEQERLGLLFEQLYTDHKKDIVSVVHNPRGKQGDNFSYTHEYAYFLYKEGEDAINPRVIPEEKRDFSNLRNWGGESKREFGNKSFYPIYVKDGEIEEIGEVPDEDFHPESRVEELEDNRFKIWPIDQNEVERKWRYAHDTLQDRLDFTKVEMSDDPQEIEVMISRPEETYKTVWSDSKFDAGSYGSKLLTSMGISEFTFPKSIHNVERAIEASKSGDSSLVMDYFAGSGTTAHAVLEINRSKNENHEYIMVEMGDYFGTTLIPRIKKTVYSSNWNDGVPQEEDGISHVFKYQKIEDYEDTLNNLDTGDDQTGVEEFTSNTLEYFLNFEVDGESLLDLDGLKDPFNYEMKIREGDEAKRETIDLVETFNYLLGLEVEKIRRYEKLDREYRIIKGTKDEEDIAVVWRPVSEDDEEEFYEDEREFLKSEVLGDEDTVYINHDSALEAKPIEKTFQERMWK
ncbi:MAG: DNA methyltransferase, partial [Candidatus Nanohaloarchaea archaeon]